MLSREEEKISGVVSPDQGSVDWERDFNRSALHLCSPLSLADRVCVVRRSLTGDFSDPLLTRGSASVCVYVCVHTRGSLTEGVVDQPAQREK